MRAFLSCKIDENPVNMNVFSCIFLLLGFQVFTYIVWGSSVLVKAPCECTVRLLNAVCGQENGITLGTSRVCYHFSRQVQ